MPVLIPINSDVDDNDDDDDDGGERT